jgi:hypothetical protein
MFVIIPRITNDTKRSDLRDFVETVLESWFRLPFSAHPRIVSHRILTVNNRDGTTQRHGLVNLTPDDAALMVIRRLNSKNLNGKRVGVKHYDATVKQTINQHA